MARKLLIEVVDGAVHRKTQGAVVNYEACCHVGLVAINFDVEDIFLLDVGVDAGYNVEVEKTCAECGKAFNIPDAWAR